MEIDTKEGEKNIWMKKCLLQKHDLSEEKDVCNELWRNKSGKILSVI